MLFAIHDLAGVGRCSLGVIIPTVAALGVQPVAIPTGVLSSHTGGLGKPACVDLTQHMWDTLRHYETLDIVPKAIYTGYLASEEQVECCSAYFSAYLNAIRIVDPVLGDHGKAYSGIEENHIQKMKDLVTESQVLLPNLTECSLLLGHTYKENPTLEECNDYIMAFQRLGAKDIIIKGIPFENDKLGNLIFSQKENEYDMFLSEKIPVSFPGTGDIFASVVGASLVNGKSLRESVSLATDFLFYTIKKTVEKNINGDTRYGVALEECLPWLYQNQHREKIN